MSYKINLKKKTEKGEIKRTKWWRLEMNVVVFLPLSAIKYINILYVHPMVKCLICWEINFKPITSMVKPEKK